ncbi:alpha/beta hydrolase-fold protein [Massilia sp. MB5]|uniref:alpha/beta hydrolase n=1 Tax=Massilia sp. MB5 TaxID=2919578 RepID=UPI001F0D9AF1|nr:alpha/beta hydrolase-fold protein [Massilia sp. MB5]UMR31244.1 alpha/beta hydrolase-fold protein [Massilia sp. MB5]
MTARRKVLAAMAATVAAAAFSPLRAAEAFSKAAPLSIGDTFTIDSRHLGETRRINVYMARGWNDAPDAPLPVLYMPDGGLAEDFLHVAGLLQVSVANGTMRSFMLVGIENTQRRRDLTGPTEVAEDRKIAPVVGGSAAYRAFIREELMPQVKARYRTTPESAIIGESLAGLFVMETFLQEPQLFDTYIAIDPSLWWNKRQLLQQAGARLRAHQRLDKTLYVAASGEKGMPELAQQLEAALAGSKVEGLRWQLAPLPDETHLTVYHPAALRAFRSAFKPG